MNEIIEVNGLTKQFGTKMAVDHVSFTVKQGEVFGLLGHNGAGKSTTIDLILGLKKPDEGYTSVLGMDARKYRKALFEKVGVQLQSTSYQNNIKVAEICQEISALYKQPEEYKELLEQFGLSETANRKVEDLSGGERQKLSVLLALIPKPEVIFLDELTTGLDTVARREVWRVLLALKRRGVTILLTSHYMDEVEVLCDNILILNHGKEVVSGSVKELIASTPYQRLEDAYLWFMDEEVIA